jgi:hypothetical protein
VQGVRYIAPEFRDSDQNQYDATAWRVLCGLILAGVTPYSSTRGGTMASAEQYDGPADELPIPEEDLKLLRRRMGNLSQAAFGRIVKVSGNNWARVENGRGPLVGPLRALVLWLMSVYAVPGGRTPHGPIPLLVVPFSDDEPSSRGKSKKPDRK